MPGAEVPVTFGSVWLLGVALGLTACTVTCLPFMGSWALAREGGMRAILLDTLAFLSGRLVAYTCLGALAGALGAWLVMVLSAGIGNVVIGLASLLGAIWLLWPHRADRTARCEPVAGWAQGSPFLIGISLTLIPCTPLTTLLATCAAGNSALTGAAYGACFGMGTLLTPMLILIPACGRFGQSLRAQRTWLVPWVRGFAALVLVALGQHRLGLFDPGLAWGMPVIALLSVFWVHLRIRRTARPPRRRVIFLKRIS